MTLWTKEQEEYLVAQVKIGTPVLQIAKALGKSPTACYHKKFQLGLSDERRPHPVYSDEAKIEEVLRLYNEGYLVKKIAEMTGLTIDLTRNILNRKHVKPRKKFLLQGARTYSPELVETVKRMFLEEEMTQKAIAAKLGMRSTQIRDLCLSRGFRRNNDWSSEQLEAMKTMLLNGYSVESTCAAIGKSRSAVLNKGWAIEAIRSLESFRLCSNEYAYKTKSLNSVLKARLKSASRSPVTRGLEYNIDLEYVKNLFIHQDGKCFYTGEPLTSASGKSNTLSIDRFDSNKGYVQGNVVLCCWVINKMKQNIEVEDFLSACRKLVKKFGDSIVNPPPNDLPPVPESVKFDFSKPLL